MVNAVLVIKFITVADSPSLGFPLTSAAAIGFSILVLPLLDTLRVFSIRIARGRSPFVPDRNHIHHLLLDRGLTHRQVTLSCVGLNVSFIAMSYFGRAMGPTTLIGLMILITYALVGALFLLRKPAPSLVIASSFNHSSQEALQTTSKVVTLKNEVAVAEQ
jgi:hypothetical protein